MEEEKTIHIKNKICFRCKKEINPSEAHTTVIDFDNKEIMGYRDYHKKCWDEIKAILDGSQNITSIFTNLWKSIGGSG